MSTVKVGDVIGEDITIGVLNGKYCAIKTKPSTDEQARNELMQFQIVDNEHPNIVRMLHDVTEKGKIRMFLEFAPIGSLYKYANVRPLDDQSISGIFRQLKSGLQFLHCDIKPDNILVFDSGTTFKFADFDLSKFMAITEALKYGYELRELRGAALYMAPELFSSNRPRSTASCDIWSLGATLVFCMLGQHFFRGQSIEEIKLAVCAWRGFSAAEGRSLEQKYSNSFPIVSRMLDVEPSYRHL